MPSKHRHCFHEAIERYPWADAIETLALDVRLPWCTLSSLGLAPNPNEFLRRETTAVACFSGRCRGELVTSTCPFGGLCRKQCCTNLELSFVEGASESRFDFWTVAGGLAFLMALAFVRLLSERPERASRKETKMNGRHKATQINSSSHRTYLQFMLETIWTTGAGVMVTSLATLSERDRRASKRAPFVFFTHLGPTTQKVAGQRGLCLGFPETALGEPK